MKGPPDELQGIQPADRLAKSTPSPASRLRRHREAAAFADVPADRSDANRRLVDPREYRRGFGRRHPKDKAKFYTIAKGSADELKDQLIFTRDKGYWKDNLAVQAKLVEVCRMLRSLIEKTLEGA
jgi:hypothetical protein